LWAVKIDGSGRRRLTPADLPVEDIGGDTGRVSPDGPRIVFASDGSIWTIGVDGSSVAQKVFTDANGGIAITPTWSPDGQVILFGLDPPSTLATSETAPQNGLYVIRNDGSDLTPFLISPDWKREPEWRT